MHWSTMIDQNGMTISTKEYLGPFARSQTPELPLNGY
jgi:hypothetical protein